VSDDLSTLDCAAEPPDPWWLSIVEWALMLALIALIGMVIAEVYWALAFVWVTARLWSDCVRIWRHLLSLTKS